MAPNERAQKNHEEVFPGHVSTLALTDPELIEIFDNFAFDEVLNQGQQLREDINQLGTSIADIGYPRTLNGLRAVDEITLPESKKP